MVSPDVFSRMVSAVDFVYIDCKHYDSEKHRQGTGAENQCILQNIKRLTNSGKDYCVRIPVIPGFNDAQEDAQAFCRLFQQLGVQNVELLPFHQLGENKYHKYHLPYSYQGVRQLHKEDLSCYFQVFQEHQLNVTLK